MFDKSEWSEWVGGCTWLCQVQIKGHATPTTLVLCKCFVILMLENGSQRQLLAGGEMAHDGPPKAAPMWIMRLDKTENLCRTKERGDISPLQHRVSPPAVLTLTQCMSPAIDWRPTDSN